jgi:hypothetical protein
MMKKIYVLFCLLLFIKNFSQSQQLIGEWFLDRIVNSKGQNLEINNPKYSMFISYKINSNELTINDNKFKAKFLKDQIKLENRNLKYWFETDYLLIQEDNEIYLFLKSNDFIKKYPEFTPKTESRNNNTVMVANKLFHPIFNNEKTFDDFLISNMAQESSKNMDDLYFKAEYILTKDNKITHIDILNKRTPQYDSQFIQALKMAETYFENPYGKDMLITEEKHFLKFFNDLTKKDEKDLFIIIENGNNYYRNNNFLNVIQEFNKLDDLNIEKDRFTFTINDAQILLGISYLATGQNEKACTKFKKVGDLTNFQVRNYLIDFCK